MAVAGRELPGKVNYIHGNDPSKWRMGLPTYEQVTERSVYPGIDVVYRDNAQQLEFDLVVRPGADVNAVRVRFAGADAVSLDPSGAVEVRTKSGDLKLLLPVIYQEVEGRRKSMRGSYKLLRNREVAFQVEDYDRKQTLVIDPTISYFALLGGGTYSNSGSAVAVDSSGNAYLAGTTAASDFPVVNAAYPQLDGSYDGFVFKINAAGTALIYSTYIGGSGDDHLTAIAVDSTGAVWVTGWTSSPDFPTLNAYQSSFGGDLDAIVFKLSPSGSLAYSTYLGGNGLDEGYGVAVDPADNAYVAGWTTISGFPVTAGSYLSAYQRSGDAFVAKFTSTGALTYSTFLGGSNIDAAYSVAADSSGNAYVTGNTNSTSFPGAPAGGAYPTLAGGIDAFVAKLNPTGTALLYFTYLGGSLEDSGTSIAVDASGNAYAGGYTHSPDLPVTPGTLQASAFGPAGTVLAHGFVAKLNPAGSAFSYVTYLGGNRTDYIWGLGIDAAGNVLVSGYTDSDQFPVANPVETTIAGNVADVQLIIDQALGVIPAVNDLNGDNVVNVADVQIVIDAALGLGCAAR